MNVGFLENARAFEKLILGFLGKCNASNIPRPIFLLALDGYDSDIKSESLFGNQITGRRNVGAF